LKSPTEILSLIAFLLGSPLYFHRRPKISTPPRPLPVQSKAASPTQEPLPSVE
jgi:hypothetical protein